MGDEPHQGGVFEPGLLAGGLVPGGKAHLVKGGGAEGIQHLNSLLADRLEPTVMYMHWGE